jgi:hypothetical protein
MFETHQTTSFEPHVSAAAPPSFQRRRCGAAPGLDGVCEGCRRDRLTSSQASTSTAHDATEHVSTSSTHGHAFGRVSVLAPQDQTPKQSGGLDEKFMQGGPDTFSAPAGGPDVDLGEKTSRDSNTPVVDSVALVTSSAGAVGGFDKGVFSCDVDLNQPGPFNDAWYSGSVANVHQVHFHLSQGRPEDLRAKRLIKRTSNQNGNVRTKPGTDGASADDGPPLHEYQFTKDKLVIADAPGYCWGMNGLKDSQFPMTYTADFSVYAYDPLDNRVVASISFHVEIKKQHFMEFNPTNTATVTGLKIGGAVPSPVKAKK